MSLEMFAPWLGLVILVWISLGVMFAGFRYPGYSHSRQFCSELGASGAPTERFSPRINNYPLGVMFMALGAYLLPVGGSGAVLGALVIVHGLGTWVAGYFPMDADPLTLTPSRACKIHSWAGLLMILSLLLAQLIGVVSDSFSPQFRLISLLLLLLTVVFMLAMAKAFRQQTMPGLYQRLSYGCQLVWLAYLPFGFQ